MGIINWVIFLKKNTKLFLKTVVISALCLFLFIGVGYLYLNKNFVSTETKNESVPYYQETPKNCGILFEVLGDKTFFYLDFDNSKISVLLYPNDVKLSDNEIYGYSIDYSVNADVDFIADLVDYLEGIELNIHNETLRYTGVQVVDIILDDKELSQKKQILNAITKKIAKNGIGKDMLLYMIENCDTNLTVPDFYYWPEYLQNISCNLQIIDA